MWWIGWGHQERPDLWTEAWEGGEYVGSSWNDLTALLVLAAAVVTVGVGVALLSRGVLWDVATTPWTARL